MAKHRGFISTSHISIVSWLGWVKKTPMSVTRHNQNVVYWRSDILLNMVSSRTGMIWRRSGITLSTMSFVLRRRNIQCSWQKPPLTPRPIVRRWRKSFSKPSTLQPFTSRFRPCCLYMLQVVPPVSFWTQVMVSLTLCQSTRALLCLTQFPVSTWLVVILLTTWWEFSLSVVILFRRLPSEKLFVTWRRSFAMSP